MFKNYLKIAWRNIRKQKFYTAINVMGLTIGMTCCFLIFMYVRFELSYDKFHEKGDRIYRLVTDVKTPTELIEAEITSGAMAPNLKADFPEVLEAIRVNTSSLLMQKGDVKIQEDRVLTADSSFFKTFDFALLKGKRESALKDPYSIVLSQRSARKYFGDSDPVGQSLLLEGKYSLTVTGVMKNVPENSHLPFDMVMSMTTLSKSLDSSLDRNWGGFSGYTYLELPAGYDAQRLEKKLPAFMERHVGTMMKESKMYYTLHLEPLKDVYMHSKRGAPVKGNLTNVYIFSVVAIFILLIAVINFVNLATAKATERAREVGVRKSVGAYDSQLTIQFLCETLVLSLIAFVLSLALCQLLLPWFKLLAGKELRHFIFDNADPLWFLGIAVAVGLLAGIYPAVVLSSYKPVTVLKGAFSNSTKGLLLRRGLVVFQFVITIGLIAGVVVIYKQLTYLQHKQTGFKKDQVMVVNFSGIEDMGKKWAMIKREALQQPGVTGASFSSTVPGRTENSAYSLLENREGEMQASNIALYFVDFDFVKQYQIKVLAGRSFSGDMATDTTQAMMVNEAVVSTMGFTRPEEIIGKRFSQWGREGKIIGVFRNFNYHSLREKIGPLTMRIGPGDFSALSVQVAADKVPEAVAGLGRVFSQVAPERRFSYFFLDQDFNNQYKNDQRFGRLILSSAILAIVLAGLGLLGLISYMVIQRTKEIGIRKVLGASVGNILFLLSRDFLKLVVIALLIATPLTWYIMSRWLTDFAYRISVEWWMFVLAGGLAVLIAVLTVSLQTIKAALANPIRSLRTE